MPIKWPHLKKKRKPSKDEKHLASSSAVVNPSIPHVDNAGYSLSSAAVVNPSIPHVDNAGCSVSSAAVVNPSIVDNAGFSQLCQTNTSTIGSIQSLYQTLQTKSTRDDGNFDRGRPAYRTYQFGDKADILTEGIPRFQPRTSRRSSTHSNRSGTADNFSVIQQINLDQSATIKQLRTELENATSFARNKAEEVRNKEEEVVKVRRESEVLRDDMANISANFCLAESIAKLQTDLNKSLEANNSACSIHESVAESLRVESMEVIRLENKLVEIQEKTDHILDEIMDGNESKANLSSEMQSLRRLISSGQDCITDELKHQEDLNKVMYNSIDSLVQSLKDISSTITLEDGVEELPRETQQLCAKLVKLIGTRIYDFGIALGIPIDIVSTVCTRFQDRTDLTQTFLVMLAEAKKCGALSESQLLRACQQIKVNPFRDIPLSPCQLAALQKMTSSIAGNVYPSAVAIQMRRNGALTSSDIDYILSPPAVHVQTQRLLDVLPFLGEHGFKAFLVALRDIGSGYVADQLEELISMDEVGYVTDTLPGDETVRSHGHRQCDYTTSLETSHWHANVQVQLAEIRAMLTNRDIDKEQFV